VFELKNHGLVVADTEFGEILFPIECAG